jgi:hypothetical protein
MAGKILIGCEFSGIVRKAFTTLGYDAVSCDLQPTEIPGPHHQGDVLAFLDSEVWDLGIFHPPCTHLAISGARWFKDKLPEQEKALNFIERLWQHPNVKRKVIEQPRSIATRVLGKRHQEIQPWQFGHAEMKSTWLWFDGVPPLEETNYIPGPYSHRIHKMPPGITRSNDRSRTFPGIAAAMAAQWGPLLGR